MAGLTTGGAAAPATSLVDRAAASLPGGVNSPVRAFRSVGGPPRFIARGLGSRVWDEDGVELIDYIGAWGPLLFGHAAPAVVEAVRAAALEGVCFGTSTRLEVEYAEAVVRVSRQVEAIRCANSGTEAVMTALRLARAHTGRSTVLVFDGCYHGHADTFLVSAAGSRAVPRPGVPDAVAADVVIAPYNDVDSVRRLARAHRLAAIFVEPVAANMGVVAPRTDFLESLRDICDDSGALLVFDEVVTGFRLARGGAAEYYGIRPDLVVYGKVAGGGLPIGVVAGSRSLLSRLAPEGDVFHGGTFAGNPMTMAAGLAQLRSIEADPGLYGRLERLGQRLEDGLVEAARVAGVTVQIARVGSMWTLFFAASRIENAAGASAADRGAFARFFHAMLSRGILLAPSPGEANFISGAHSEEDIERTIGAASGGFGEVLRS